MKRATIFSPNTKIVAWETSVKSEDAVKLLLTKFQVQAHMILPMLICLLKDDMSTLKWVTAWPENLQLLQGNLLLKTIKTLVLVITSCPANSDTTSPRKYSRSRVKTGNRLSKSRKKLKRLKKLRKSKRLRNWGRHKKHKTGFDYF